MAHQPPANANSLKDVTVGISYFVTSAPGFTGILKQRFADFIVNEVDLQGNVVHLTELIKPNGANKMADDMTEEEWAAFVSDPDRAAGLEPLVAINGPDTLAMLAPLVVSKKGEDGVVVPKPAFVLLPPCEDKENRKKTHQLIREYLPCFATDVADDATDPKLKLIRVFCSKNARKVSSFDKRMLSWPTGRPDYTQFVLCKQNMDTLAAVSEVCRWLHTSDARIGYAGNKDRRAVTSQLCTVYRIAPERLAEVNARSNTVRVGNPSFVDTELQLGSLKGNQFHLVLRNVSVDGEGDGGSFGNVGATMRAWDGVDNAFVNYFGLQRFGSSSVPTFDLGKSMLKHAWEETMELLIGPKPEDPATVRQAKDYFKATKDAFGAMRMIPRQHYVENALFRSLGQAKGGSTTRQILMAIPRGTRLLYLHSYQSFIWNHVATKRLETLGSTAPVVGDLVLVNPDDADKVEEEPAVEEAVDGDVTADAAPAEEAGGEGEGEGVEAEAEAGAEAEPAAVTAGAGAGASREGDGSGEGSAVARALPTGPATGAYGLPKVRALTAEDIASGKYSIFDVVMPVPGFATEYPLHACGRSMVEDMLRADGLEPSEAWSQRKHREMALVGAYRPLLRRAFDVKWDVVQYTDPVANLSNEHLDVGDWRGFSKDYTGAAGAGAGTGTVGAETGAGAGSSDGAEPGSDAVPAGTDPAATAVEGGGNAGPSDVPSSTAGEAPPVYHALKLSFKLGKSSYATMCLRELLKSSTNTELHKSLNTVGPGALTREVVDTSGTGAAGGVTDGGLGQTDGQADEDMGAGGEDAGADEGVDAGEGEGNDVGVGEGAAEGEGEGAGDGEGEGAGAGEGDDAGVGEGAEDGEGEGDRADAPAKRQRTE